MDGLLEPWQILKYEVCFDCCVWCVAQCQLVKVYGVCVIPWNQEDMVHGFQQWQDRCWPGYQACPLQMMRGVQTCSAADVARELDIYWVVCTLGAKESHRWWQSSFYGTLWAFLVSIGHVTLIKESGFGAETWLITQNLKPEKWYVIEKLSSPSGKENGSIVFSKDDCGKLSWDHKHVLVLDFLDHGDTVCWLL